MYRTSRLLILSFFVLTITSCVSKKKFAEMQTSYEDQLELANKQIGICGEDLNEYINKSATCETERDLLKTRLELREEQLADSKLQVADAKLQRDQQLSQVENLTVLSKSANDNIKETLDQMEQKDKYIQMIQAAKTKTDSINLALAVNLKGVLAEGIADDDVDIRVDKTVVFVNLSDKMLYKSGSSNLTSRATDVLGKIAEIIKARPNLEVMVEGYTDNVPISGSCYKDNWDLSVKRSTSVIRVLQNTYGIDPNRLIAAGRGEYNTLTTNDTAEGRSINRRTRIIILPKLDEFYDLLNPSKVPE